MKEGVVVVYCDGLRKKGIVKGLCCENCHYRGGMLMHEQLKDGRYVFICCDVRRKLLQKRLINI